MPLKPARAPKKYSLGPREIISRAKGIKNYLFEFERTSGKRNVEKTDVHCFIEIYFKRNPSPFFAGTAKCSVADKSRLSYARCRTSGRKCVPRRRRRHVYYAESAFTRIPTTNTNYTGTHEAPVFYALADAILGIRNGVEE